VRAALPEHMVPSAVVVLDRFPTLLNGKIDRKALAERASLPRLSGSLVEGADADVAGSARSFEKLLCGLVAETLEVSDVTPQDNFFDLGGHSVLAARLASRMRKELGVTVPMRSLFEAGTLAELAEIMAQAGPKS
jgi:acyl carrier protein